MTDHYAQWKGWDGDFGRFKHEDELYYAQELRASGISSVVGLKIGELGYGNGAFAGWLRNAGARWIGRELIPELQKRAEDAGFGVVPSEVDFASACGPGQLDLLVAFDVVEHLDIGAVRSFLIEAKEVLKPRGLLLLRLPSGDSPFSGAIYSGDIIHRTLLGSSAARQLALETGLEICQIRSHVLPVYGLGPLRAMRRIAVRIAQVVAFSFIRKVLMGNESAVVSPNMIVVLRKKHTSN